MSTEAVETILRERPLTETNRAQLATVANSLPPSELDYLMDSMPVVDAAELFRVLHPELALEVFEDLPDSQQADLVEELGVEDSTALIAELDPDDRAGLFDELSDENAEHFMRGLDATERHMTTSVLEYSREEIGRYMSPEVIGLLETLTATEALEYIQTRIDEPETIYLLPVLNDQGTLQGVVGLRKLMGADPSVVVGELAKEASFALATEDREEVARRFLAEKLLAMPVVDPAHKLIGILTIDDVLDIIEEEDEEDAARGGGAEPLRRSYLSTPIQQIVKSRIVWLLVLAVSAILTVHVLELFEDKLNEVVVLALFIPLLTGTGGNTGNQAATTVTRACPGRGACARSVQSAVARVARGFDARRNPGRARFCDCLAGVRLEYWRRYWPYSAFYLRDGGVYWWPDAYCGEEGWGRPSGVL